MEQSEKKISLYHQELSIQNGENLRYMPNPVTLVENVGRFVRNHTQVTPTKLGHLMTICFGPFPALFGSRQAAGSRHVEPSHHGPQPAEAAQHREAGERVPPFPRRAFCDQ